MKTFLILLIAAVATCFFYSCAKAQPAVQVLPIGTQLQSPVISGGMTVAGPIVANGVPFSTPRSTIFINTNSVMISNTASALSTIPNGIGTVTLPANYFTNGLANGHSTIEFTFAGIYTTPGLGTPSVTVAETLGANSLATVTTTSLALGAANYRMAGVTTIECFGVTNGVGTFGIDGALDYRIATGSIFEDPLNNGGNTLSFGVTNAMTFNVTAQWDSASTTRTATITKCIGEALN